MVIHTYAYLPCLTDGIKWISYYFFFFLDLSHPYINRRKHLVPPLFPALSYSYVSKCTTSKYNIISCEFNFKYRGPLCKK